MIAHTQKPSVLGFCSDVSLCVRVCVCCKSITIQNTQNAIQISLSDEITCTMLATPNLSAQVCKSYSSHTIAQLPNGRHWRARQSKTRRKKNSLGCFNNSS